MYLESYAYMFSFMNTFSEAAVCIKKRLRHGCFPVNIAKFLRMAFLWNSSGGCFCIFLKLIKQPFRRSVNLNS